MLPRQRSSPVTFYFEATGRALHRISIEIWLKIIYVDIII
jgi:hypothetical protein